MENILHYSKIEGVFEITIKKLNDNRGYFSNIFRANEEVFSSSWNRPIKQINLSLTKQKGTIRGLHLQRKPDSEAKLIRCVRGTVFDIAVDLRKNSPTYLSWHAVELDSEKNNVIIIPEGCAHGFQTLTPNCEMLYVHSNNWVSSSEIGIRYNDTAIGITWPIKCTELSDRDRNLPFLESIDL